MIRARAITKRYGGVAALQNVTLDVAAGECLGLTGTAGGGRSTLLRVLATRIPSTSGTLAIGGIDAVGPGLFAVRQRIAYAGNACAAGAGLRVDEYLRLILHTRGTGTGIEHARRVRGALAQAEVNPTTLIDRLGRVSRGFVETAAALLARADVLFLDLRASDWRPRTAFLECLVEARSGGAALVLASDDKDTLDVLCDRTLRCEGGLVTDDRRNTAAAMSPRAISAVTERS